MPTANLDDLFPTPSSPPSTLSPTVWPGISRESTSTLQKYLKENHEKFHIFFNDKRFHNHTSHHLLAVWALGASGPIIEAAYKINASYQQPTYDSPQLITSENFQDHLGDKDYWSAYLSFFSRVLLEKGAAATLEEYIFSPKANFDPTREGKAQPEMLNRFVSGLLHPLIHTGYGVEFGLHGIVAEGLAQAAIHHASVGSLIRPSLFQSNNNAVVSRLTALIPSLALDNISSAQRAPSGIHAFTILARIINDPELHAEPSDYEDMHVLGCQAELVRKYAEQWTVDMTDPAELAKKIEELAWTNALIYGVGGWATNRSFKPDFFLMHLVTSSLFLSSLTAYLNPASQTRLLRAYFVVSLTCWVSRGLPALNISQFFDSTTARPKPPGGSPNSAEDTLPSPHSPDAATPNPWLPLIQTALVHPGEHLCKIQRALAHYATLYGCRTGKDFQGTELVGAENLDGSLFIRVAGLTADALGWMREGENQGRWSHDGF